MHLEWSRIDRIVESHVVAEDELLEVTDIDLGVVISPKLVDRVHKSLINKIAPFRQ